MCGPFPRKMGQGSPSWDGNFLLAIDGEFFLASVGGFFADLFVALFDWEQCDQIGQFIALRATFQSLRQQLL